MNAKLAIIDDHVVMRAFLAEYFRLFYDVVAFSNAPEALQRLEEGYQPDLITVDLMMPGMTGIDFLNCLRDHPPLHAIPVIVISGVDKSLERIRCLEAGAVDFLTKPFNPQELAIRIRHQLRARKSWIPT